MKTIILLLVSFICYLELYSQNKLDNEKVLGSFVNDKLGLFGVNMIITYRIEKNSGNDTTYCLTYEAHKYISFKKPQNYRLLFKNTENAITNFRLILLKAATSKEKENSFALTLGDYTVGIFKRIAKRKNTLYICFADKDLLKKQYTMGDKDFSKMMSKAYEERLIEIEFKDTEENYIVDNIKHLFGN